ncbi:hypothetical protein RND81_03G186800 [Saponaria officinalis]|uniref:Pentatricopeptide repeat-containing protein n=1 Tax=Saponaria officinalis TaxID=3572 RepID=A0AAW1M180_SAPOF
MHHQFRPLMNFFRRVAQPNGNLRAIPLYQFCCTPDFFPLSSLPDAVTFRAFHFGCDPKLNNLDADFLGVPSNSREKPMHVNETALRVQNILKKFSYSSNEERAEALDNCELSLSDDLVLDVLRRHHSDWNSAFQFFNWVTSVADLSGYTPSSEAYNGMLGTLGKARQFEELQQIFDEMFKRGVMNQRSYDIVLHRYAAAHKIDDAIEFFYKREQYGLELDLAAFQSLLMSLCRYKHVETAEDLFHAKKEEFRYDIKTWNIILNGWCVLRNLHETKRFWNELVHSDCKPDKYSYGTYINSLCKSGKVSSAVKLFRSMWENGCTPDTVICNSVIDGLCFKKRVPEALEIFREMDAKGCQPNVSTYNCLIKYMCKIRRMEMASKLLSEMEEKGGDCTPNDMTFIYLLTVAKKPDEVVSLLDRMKRQGCEMTGDVYNLVLRLYLSWDSEEHVQSTWADMSRDGIGPDQRSYTVMIHKRYDQGKLKDALDYFKEMTLKKLTPEPRTMLLVNAMKSKLEEKQQFFDYYF